MFKAIFETAMHRFASKVYPGRHDLCVLFIIWNKYNMPPPPVTVAYRLRSIALMYVNVYKMTTKSFNRKPFNENGFLRIW